MKIKNIIYAFLFLAFISVFTSLGQVSKPAPTYRGRRTANPDCTQTGQYYYNLTALEFRSCSVVGTPGTWDAMKAVAGGTGLNNLNGAVATTQNFAAGTGGTDFNISTADPTHTFNIPTASATARGLLTSANFSTFNGKQAGVQFQDEGTNLGASATATSVNCVGSGITCSRATDAITVTVSGGGGSGDVVGPASATDNAIARFDTTTGKLIQNSLVTIDDTGVTAFTAGSKTAPSLHFGTATTGLYGATNFLGLGFSAVSRVFFDFANNVQRFDSAAQITFSNTSADPEAATTTGIGRDAAGVLEVTDGSIGNANLKVADEVYNATSWDGSQNVPTKNSVRDKIEAIIAGTTITTGTTLPGTCSQGQMFMISTTGRSYECSATNTWSEKPLAATGGSAAYQKLRINSTNDGWNLATETSGNGITVTEAASTTTYAIDPASTTDVLTGTSTTKPATADAVAALWEQGSDIASAATISVGEGGQFNITGTTAITDIDFATDKTGRTACAKFAGALTLTHNATTLILPTGANITTAAGDVACFRSEGTDAVRITTYTRANGQALVDNTGGVSDGDKGDITVTAAGLTWTIDNDVVTYAKMQNISATDRLLGRDTAAAGDPEELTVGGGVEFTGTGGIQTSAFTGDVTKAAGGTATTIADNAVTNAKAADVATNTIKGRVTAATGDPEDLTPAQALTVLESGGTNIVVATEIDTSAELAGILGDETGSGGGFVRATAPTIDSPVLSTKVNLPRVTAFPGTPAAGDTVIVTDDSAAGACDSAAGSVTSLCQYNGTSWVAVGDGNSGTGAPTNATYITQTANGTLTNEQALEALATGIVKNTTTTGVLSIAVAGDFPTLNQNTTGTAAALTANGANCAAGNYPLGVDASGAAESCTAIPVAATTTQQLTGTDTAAFATSDSVAALWEQGSDVASAGIISIGEGGYVNITGVTTITDIDFATDKTGRRVWVKFTGILTLTHNATTLILPTGANITTAAGDTALIVSEGTDAVRVLNYSRASGVALVGGGGGSVATDVIFDAKGDLPVGTGADTAAKLTVGANDTFLVADSAQTTGLKWANAATSRAALGVAFYRDMLNGSSLNPDTSGEVFLEPYANTATNDFWKHNIWIFASPTADRYLYGTFELTAPCTSGAAFKFVWTSQQITGTLQYALGYRVVTGDDTNSLDQTTSQERVTGSDTAPGAVNRRMEVTITPTNANFSTAGTVAWRLERVDTSDTLAGSIGVAGLRFTCTP